MNENETNTTPEKTLSRKSYDEEIFNQYQETASFEAYEYLDGDKQYRNDQKLRFLSGELQNPVLDYPKIDGEKIRHFVDELKLLKSEIVSSSTLDHVVSQTYRWRLNQKIAEAKMLLSTINGDSKRFLKYSKFAFGEPSLEVFAYTTNSITDEAKGDINSEDAGFSSAARDLVDSLPELSSVEFASLPSDETLATARQQTMSELGDLIKIPEGAKKVDSQQIKEAFDYALQKIGDDNWTVSIEEDSSKTAISVNQESMTVRVPQERSVTTKKLGSLILHEIGTHVARRVKGERSKLKLLSLGLDRYEAGDEGVATMREQAYNDKIDDYRGLEKYLAIGLAYGIDGQPRDFRQTFQIMEKYFYYKKLKAGKSQDEARTSAQDSAWTNTLRTFRGTDCQTPGACFTKDLAYRQGSVGVWDVVKENPSEMLRFNVGKYDPSNPRHIWILEQLGISDQDLDELEK